MNKETIETIDEKELAKDVIKYGILKDKETSDRTNEMIELARLRWH